MIKHAFQTLPAPKTGMLWALLLTFDSLYTACSKAAADLRAAAIEGGVETKSLAARTQLVHV